LKEIHQAIEKIYAETQYDESAGNSREYDDDDVFSDVGSIKYAKREKSLGILSIGFIKLYCKWKKIISLEQAARKLSTDKVEENKVKTKIRRLYDIANVFQALGLIKKTYLEQSRKPAFEWVGL